MTDSTDTEYEQHPDLNDFDGKPVIAAAVEMSNTGHGLTAAMAIEAEEFEPGEYVNILVRCLVMPPKHEPIKLGPGEFDFDAFTLINRLRAETMVKFDTPAASKALAAQQKKIDEHRAELAEQRKAEKEAARKRKAAEKARAEQEAAGQQTLPEDAGTPLSDAVEGEDGE